jgi:hypothetical protein
MAAMTMVSPCAPATRKTYDDDVVVTPAPSGADAIERLRSELAGMRNGRVPLYWLGQITRGRVAAALDLLDGVEEYDEIRGTPATPTAVLDLARDLFCARAAELECMEATA